MESIEERRARVAGIASALPEVEVRPSPHGQHSGARVRGKAFAYFTVDHHGDGRVAVTFKAPPGGRDALIAADPERWFWPPYMGVHGWVGLDLDAPGVDWDEVAAHLRESYRLIAPKRPAAQVE